MSALAQRGTILIPSGPAHDLGKRHLFILLTEPYGPANQILLAPVCSVNKNGVKDDSCILDIGVHPFIDHRSFVDYALCRIERASKIQRGIDTMLFAEKETIPAEIFPLIVKGLRDSPFTKPFALEFYEDFEKSI